MIKLVDVPEMNYFAANNCGEVCAFGPNVFTGYLCDEEKTAEALDSDGWLHTGDIGTWTEVVPAGHAGIAVKFGENLCRGFNHHSYMFHFTIIGSDIIGSGQLRNVTHS